MVNSSVKNKRAQIAGNETITWLLYIILLVFAAWGIKILVNKFAG